MTDKKDNIVDIKSAKKKKTQLILFKTTDTEPKEPEYSDIPNNLKSCFNCLHYREPYKKVSQCGHYPQGEFHQVTIGPCSYEHGKFLWAPKQLSLWTKIKQKLFD